MRRVLILLGLFWASVVQGQSPGMETGWLEFVKGYQDDKVGVQIREIEATPTGEGSRVTIAVPRIAIPDLDSMEEVLVVGQKPEEAEPWIQLEYEYEWVQDYDNDYYGLILYLREGSKWPIRLFVNSEPGFVR